MHSLAPMQARYLNAIVYCRDQQGRERWLKYHTIQNNAHKTGKFATFIKEKFADAQYINFYSKETRQFSERLYLE